MWEPAPERVHRKKRGLLPTPAHTRCATRGERRSQGRRPGPGAPPALGVPNSGVSGEQVRALPGGASPVAGEDAAGPRGTEGEAGNGERAGESDLEN